MSSPALHHLSLQQQAALLQNKSTSASALAQHYLDRAAAHPELGAFATQNAATTLGQAQAADARLSAGEAAPLLGLPLAYQDNLVSAHFETSAGSKMLAGYHSPFDAAAIEALSAQGTVTLGKLNLDEFGLNAQGGNCASATVQNAFDAQRLPGGAASGAAVAVAAGLAPAAVGVDAGGSLLQAATHQGVLALRPSYGRISRFGIAALVSSCDQVATLSRSAADAALLLQHLAGPDCARDATSLDAPAEDFARDLGTGLAGLKIARPSAAVLADLAPATAQATEAALAQLQSLGAELLPIELPQSELAATCFELLGAAEATSNMARYDGVRFGHRSADASKLDALYTQSRSEGFGDLLQQFLILGNHVLAEAHIQSHYFQAQKVRRLMAQELHTALAGCAAIALPVAAGPAPAVGQASSAIAANRYTAAAALAGLPALSLPIGLADGLPVGLQLVGPYFGEARLLQIAAQFEAANTSSRPSPACYQAN